MVLQLNPTCPATRINYVHARLYVGSPDRPRRVSLFDEPVLIFACDCCAARFYGTVLLATPCPSCDEGTLQEVEVWDLERVAWPWLGQGGAV